MALKDKLRKLIDADQTMTPDYRKVYIAQLENAPDAFQDAQIARYEGGLRQEDYDRRMNEGKAALEKEKQDWVKTEKVPWAEWYTKAQKADTERQAALKAAQDELGKLKKDHQVLMDKIASGELTAGEENEAYKQLTGIRDQITKIPQDLEAKFQNLLSKDEAVRAQGQIYDNMFTVEDLLDEHRQKYPNIPITRRKLIEAMNENKLTGDEEGIRKAYDIVTADARKQAEAKAYEDKVNAEVEERLKKERSKTDFPMDGGSGGDVIIGPLQQRLTQLNKTVDPMAAGAPPGSAAAAAAAELRAEGKV